MRTKVLMVCLGNICRSPLAEGILKSKVNPEHIYVDSAGTAGYHVGSKPDSRSIAVARKYGIDISAQRCRQFDKNDFQAFDLIYAMDKSNYGNILAMTRNAEERSKVQLLMDLVANDITEVPDPYYGGEQGFESVFKLLDDACTELALILKAKEG